ncbi:MAG: hypothetical protein JWP97_5618 [Labilithrix sp.]|nr:hypothetical protein [Labilithrix sp.]
MASSDRRRHVRVKPTADLPARVALASGGLLREALDVLDLSVGGFALSSPLVSGKAPGERFKLQLALGAGVEHTVEVVVRWASPEGAGVELVEPTPAVAQELQRYIGELLERGGAP